MNDHVLEPDTTPEPVAVCSCSKTPWACPYHGVAPTAHDTYAQHCREHVIGTPAHGGGRCPLCDSTEPGEAPAVDHDVMPDATTPGQPNIDTMRGIVRMAALVVMEEVNEVDTALATAIAIKASVNLRDYLAGLEGGTR